MAMIRVRYTAEEFKHLDGGSDLKRLAAMTEEEIIEAAKSDPDNPPLSDEELKQFKRVVSPRLTSKK